MNDGNLDNYSLSHGHRRKPGSCNMTVFRDLKIQWTGLLPKQSLLEILGMMGSEQESTSRYNNLSHFV